MLFQLNTFNIVILNILWLRFNLTILQGNLIGSNNKLVIIDSNLSYYT